MKLYNTMSMQKEEFVPIEPGKVRMYASGETGGVLPWKSTCIMRGKSL